MNCTLSIPLVVSDALAASATLAPETVAPASGAVRETLGRPLSTVTGIDAMLITPLLFFATALRMCEPSEAVVLFQANMNGPDVSCEPMSLPSSWNCTLAMPLGSDAFAETVTAFPETRPPTAGAVMVTVGAGSAAPQTWPSTPIIGQPAGSSTLCRPHIPATVNGRRRSP